MRRITLSDIVLLYLSDLALKMILYVQNHLILNLRNTFGKIIGGFLISFTRFNSLINLILNLSVIFFNILLAFLTACSF